MQIELDPARVGARYPIEVGLVGDSRRTLAALLQRNDHRRFLEHAQEGAEVVATDGGTRDAA